MKRSLVRTLPALLLLLAAAPNPAQDAAVITGKVTDSAGAPVNAATIGIAAFNVNTITFADGTYRLVVPAARFHSGQLVALTAARIDLAPQSRTIVLRHGATITQDFRLAAAALHLEGLVATATGTEVRQERSLGFSVRIRGSSSIGVDPVQLEPSRTVPPAGFDTENYAAIDESPFLDARGNPLSTFSIDVDRASYSNVRRFLRLGRRPPRDAVRIEELLNYFPYAYPEPRGEHPFAVVTEVGPSPWNRNHLLVHVGLQGRHVDTRELPPANLVFLVDVSGSMQPANKLPLVKESLRLLVEQLRPQDRISLAVYAGAAGLVLDATPGDRKAEILAAIDRLQAGGSTAGGAGLRLAYDVALRNHVPGGNNRVVLATDGDFNVGVSSDAEMFRLVEERRAEGTYLTVLGYGMGNLKDSKLEGLADRGNGNYAYVDDLAEARKVLVSEMGGTLFTIAKDVKLQVEFNPARVAAYRLIGYENRALRAEDFDDDRKDAGELGAGHSVTALYEVIPVGARTNVRVRTPRGLRYAQRPAPTGAGSEELAFVSLRYKPPQEEESRLLSHVVEAPAAGAVLSDDFRFSAAVASFGMLLRESPHRGRSSVGGVLRLARSGVGRDREGYRSEFVSLVEQYRQVLAQRPAGDERSDEEAGGP